MRNSIVLRKINGEFRIRILRVTPLKVKGVDCEDLKKRPEYYEQFNSSNGWGMYQHFVPFVEKYLNACMEFPDAIVEVDR